jgi:hypothetical protein
MLRGEQVQWWDWSCREEHTVWVRKEIIGWGRKKTAQKTQLLLQRTCVEILRGGTVALF